MPCWRERQIQERDRAEHKSPFPLRTREENSREISQQRDKTQENQELVVLMCTGNNVPLLSGNKKCWKSYLLNNGPLWLNKTTSCLNIYITRSCGLVEQWGEQRLLLCHNQQHFNMCWKFEVCFSYWICTVNRIDLIWAYGSSTLVTPTGYCFYSCLPSTVFTL